MQAYTARRSRWNSSSLKTRSAAKECFARLKLDTLVRSLFSSKHFAVSEKHTYILYFVLNEALLRIFFGISSWKCTEWRRTSCEIRAVFLPSLTHLTPSPLLLLLAGTRVTQVRAVDRDAEDGPGPNGQVTYSIVSQHNKFTIDSNTGDLYTNAVRINKRTNGHGRVGRTFDRRKHRECLFSFSAAYSPFEIPFWRPFPRRVTEIPESLPPSTPRCPPSSPFNIFPSPRRRHACCLSSPVPLQNQTRSAMREEFRN